MALKSVRLCEGRVRVEPVVELPESLNTVVTPDHLHDPGRLRLLDPVLQESPEEDRLVTAVVRHWGGTRLQCRLKSRVEVDGLHPCPAKHTLRPWAPTTHIFEICGIDLTSIHDARLGLLGAGIT